MTYHSSKSEVPKTLETQELLSQIFAALRSDFLSAGYKVSSEDEHAIKLEMGLLDFFTPCVVIEKKPDPEGLLRIICYPPNGEANRNAEMVLSQIAALRLIAQKTTQSQYGKYYFFQIDGDAVPGENDSFGFVADEGSVEHNEDDEDLLTMLREVGKSFRKWFKK